jgi:transposase
MCLLLCLYRWTWCCTFARRALGEIDAWLEQAKFSGLLGFSSFVRGIRADYAAVKAAFFQDWSNGPTEGHVNCMGELASIC